MKPTSSNVRHYVTFKNLGNRTASFLWKILLYKPVEAYMPIKSTTPVILNSSRQAQNLLLLQLWLFVGAIKKCHGCFKLSSACKCADQQSDSSVHSHFMWKTWAELVPGKYVYLVWVAENLSPLLKGSGFPQSLGEKFVVLLHETE